jgi:hypothetical protein
MERHNGSVRLLPWVREHETNKELFWQVELPATDRVQLSLDGRVLTVRVLHPTELRTRLHTNPEATAV